MYLPDCRKAEIFINTTTTKTADFEKYVILAHLGDRTLGYQLIIFTEKC